MSMSAASTISLSARDVKAWPPDVALTRTKTAFTKAELVSYLKWYSEKLRLNPDELDRIEISEVVSIDGVPPQEKVRLLKEDCSS